MQSFLDYLETVAQSYPDGISRRRIQWLADEFGAQIEKYGADRLYHYLSDQGDALLYAILRLL